MRFDQIKNVTKKKVATPMKKQTTFTLMANCKRTEMAKQKRQQVTKRVWEREREKETRSRTMKQPTMKWMWCVYVSCASNPKRFKWKFMSGYCRLLTGRLLLCFCEFFLLLFSLNKKTSTATDGKWCCLADVCVCIQCNKRKQNQELETLKRRTRDIWCSRRNGHVIELWVPIM